MSFFPEDVSWTPKNCQAGTPLPTRQKGTPESTWPVSGHCLGRVAPLPLAAAEKMTVESWAVGGVSSAWATSVVSFAKHSHL